VRPPTTEQLDYEIELAVVIGKQAKAVPREDAMGYVLGYTIMNDVSARDLQLGKDGGIILGKNFDTSAPLGPVLVLTDEIPDPTHLQLRTWVNGELRQNGNTHTLIFDVPAIIAFLTQQLTLEPGDVIATGTPAGVGLGMKPQVWLQPGDTIKMEIDGIGVLGEPGRRLTSVQVPALVSPGGGFGIDLWNPSAMQLEIPIIWSTIVHWARSYTRASSRI